MRVILPLLASLACVGQGRRLSSALQKEQSLPKVDDLTHNSSKSQQLWSDRRAGELDPANAFAELLLASAPAAAWQTNCAPHVFTKSPVARANCMMKAKGKQKPRQRKLKVKNDRSRFNINVESALQNTPSIDQAAVAEQMANESKTELDALLEATGVTDPEYRERLELGKNDPLRKIPRSGQETLEKIWFGGTVVFGIIFILVAILESTLAVGKFFHFDESYEEQFKSYDFFITKFVSPVLTPSIVITFVNSASLGILKTFQLQSEGSGILYTEDEDPFEK
mmetsp:Transcript_64163/g.121574  ORF Transcript_64163/g.121574 Transcript_64163/m.121574 type:complete len:282 (+) Transcript_64163:68-913(+)